MRGIFLFDSDASGLIKIGLKYREQQKMADRGDHIVESGFEPGSKVMWGKDGPYTVRRVSLKTGIVTLVERKGSFNPHFLEKIPESSEEA